MKEEEVKAVFEMYDSLLQSVDNAGGSLTSFVPRKMAEMSVNELFSKLATNNIRFSFRPKE